LRSPSLANFLRFLLVPEWRRRAILRRRRHAPVSQRLEYDALGRNDYAYGMYHAARQAKALGITTVTGIEFGVFNGIGLRNMEQLGYGIHQELGVWYDLYGFDTGAGLPPPSDRRDLAYVWKTGLFAPRRDLRTFLKRAGLVIGDVAQTVPRFCREKHAPLAFVSIDVDYYTAAADCLRIFDQDPSALLPRVFTYLDDTIGGDEELHSRFAGELAAVEEFNARHEHRKIAPINGLRWKRRFPQAWNDQMHVAHIFDHPRYGDYTGGDPRWEQPAFEPAPVVVKVAPGRATAKTG